MPSTPRSSGPPTCRATSPTSASTSARDPAPAPGRHPPRRPLGIRRPRAVQSLPMHRLPRRPLFALPCLLLALACGGPDDGVADEASAERAYLGLDRAIDRAIDLGFAGFNAANSANIPEQRDAGDITGEMIVNGQVDQGSSDNKNMRLEVTLAGGYQDVVLEGDIAVTYDGGPAN